MKRYRVEFAPEARDHVRTIGAWWRAERPAVRDLFREELAATIQLLREAPLAGVPYDAPGVTGVRRVPMFRCRYRVFYTVDEEGAVVRIHAVWHASRGHGPPLP